VGECAEAGKEEYITTIGPESNERVFHTMNAIQTGASEFNFASPWLR
jgi:hypothetical protein